MNKELKYAFLIHICKYLGIALVAGSIVHAGTLGGSSSKYVFLIAIGILLTVTGNYLEYKVKNLAVGWSILFLAIALSFGTGMLSGGIQHYSDNPAYGSILLSLGLILTFVALAYKDFARVVTQKSIIIITVVSFIVYLLLSTVGASLVSHVPNDGHHEEVTTLNHN